MEKIKIMNVNRFDAHDRLKHVTRQDFSIGECCQDIINKRPFGNNPYYIWAHSRQDDNPGVRRIIWQPRLTRPNASSNSMLFRVQPPSESIEIIWIIPDSSLWDNFAPGKLSHNELINGFIQQYRRDKKYLEEPHKDDLTDARAHQVYQDLIHTAKYDKMMSQIHLRQ